MCLYRDQGAAEGLSDKALHQQGGYGKDEAFEGGEGKDAQARGHDKGQEGITGDERHREIRVGNIVVAEHHVRKEEEHTGDKEHDAHGYVGITYSV